MNLKQLIRIKNIVKVDLQMVEDIAFHAIDHYDIEVKVPFEQTAQTFTRLYFLHREIVNHLNQYNRVKDMLTRYVAGETCDFGEFHRDLGEPSIWLFCSLDILGVDGGSALYEMSSALCDYANSLYDRQKSMREAFDNFFPRTEKGYLNDKGELLSLPAELEAKMNLAADLESIELSFSVDEYALRMDKARDLCDRGSAGFKDADVDAVDPAELLLLFP